MARVLITRAEPEAEATAARLRAMDHDPIVSPVLRIEPVDAAPVRGVQAVLLSSAAAARAPSAAPYHKVLALAVGDATAEAAAEAGFTKVLSAEGAGADLAGLASRTLDPEDGLVLHLSGADIAFDLAGALQEEGFQAERAVVYRALAAPALSEAAQGALAAEPPTVDAVLFHSVRGADVFAGLAADIPPQRFARLTAICLSKRISEAVRALPWGEIRVAAEPSEDALLRCL